MGGFGQFVIETGRKRLRGEASGRANASLQAEA